MSLDVKETRPGEAFDQIQVRSRQDSNLRPTAATRLLYPTELRDRQRKSRGVSAPRLFSFNSQSETPTQKGFGEPERSPVPSATLPPETAVEADWQVFGIQQTARLSEANGRTADVISVVESCEARDRQAVKRGWFR